MAATIAGQFINIMNHEPSFVTILTNFGLSARARTHFREDFPTARSLMSSSKTNVQDVIEAQNKIFRSHAAAAQRCYINTTQLNRIVAFHRWTHLAVRDAHDEYDVADIATFTQAWIDNILQALLQPDASPTDTSSALTIDVPKYTGTNWYDVRSKFLSLLDTRIGHAGIPLSYLVRHSKLSWEDTNHMSSIQERRIHSKDHSGPDFESDNREFYRIMTVTFANTTLEDLVRQHQNSSNGIITWAYITDNVQGASYNQELKRQADNLITKAFYDPSKNFSFEKYFQVHTRAHDIMAASGSPVAEWKKIHDFMKGIKCSHLQNDYRTIKDLPTFNNNFTSFYNKMNENYRMLIEQGQIKPISIFKRKISQISSTNSGRGNNSGRGRGGRNGRGRGRGGRSNGRGRGRGGRGRGNGDSAPTNVDLSCLPPNLNLSNLQFTDDQWYNHFTQDQRNAINHLRDFRNRQRQVSSFLHTRSPLPFIPPPPPYPPNDPRTISQIRIPTSVPGTGNPPPSITTDNNSQSGMVSQMSSTVNHPPQQHHQQNSSSSQYQASQAGSAFGRWW